MGHPKGVPLILGDGSFKPNISVMVGDLYQPGDAKRGASSSVFYMGINIGALIATLLAALVAGFVYSLLPRLDAAIKKYGA